MNISLKFREQFVGDLWVVGEELDQLVAEINARTRVDPLTGAFSFGTGPRDITASQITLQDGAEINGANLVINTGTHWTKGPWLFDLHPADVAILRPPQTSGSYNDFNPQGLDTAVGMEIEPSTNTTLTGLNATQGRQRRLFLLRNRDSSRTVTLKHQSASSSAANRFDLPGAADLVIQPNGALLIWYDDSRERWTAFTPESTSTTSAMYAAIGITIDGGGAAISTGVKGYIRIPYDMTVTGLDIVADQSGSIVVDVWYDSYANFPPTVADTIAGSEKPTLSSAQKNQDTSLTTWTTALLRSRYLGFNVDSASTVTRVHVQIYGTRT